MSAEWCNNVEPHAEHYEPMPPGYTDEARVCFGITAPAMSEQIDPLVDVLAKVLPHGAVERWSLAIADAIRAAGYVHRDEVLADPTIVGMEPYVWEWPPLPGERHPTFVRRPRTDGVGTPLYRTPEVKG